MELLLKPTVLKWARERAGLSPQALAQKLGTKQQRITDWERTGKLNFKEAEKLADKTHVPFGCLYLDSPLQEPLPISDFRTLRDSEIIQASPDLLDTIDTAILRQDWFREYQIASGDEEVPFVGSLSESESVPSAVRKIRHSINWDTGVRSSISKWEDALKAQIDMIEESGVLVMKNGIVGSNTRRKLDVDEFRGFALSDKYAPLIFVNAADTLAAQMFTLAHELVHIFLGVSGVSNLDGTFPNDRKTEKFCNNVAAELLVPELELKKYKTTGDLPRILQSLGRHFKVSTLVLLRRLRDINALSYDDFRNAYVKEEDRIRNIMKGRSGGNYYASQSTRLGQRFSSALIESTLEGKTTYREALSLFGSKSVDTFKEYARTLHFLP